MPVPCWDGVSTVETSGDRASPSRMVVDYNATQVDYNAAWLL